MLGLLAAAAATVALRTHPYRQAAHRRSHFYRLSNAGALGTKTTPSKRPHRLSLTPTLSFGARTRKHAPRSHLTHTRTVVPVPLVFRRRTSFLSAQNSFVERRTKHFFGAGCCWRIICCPSPTTNNRIGKAFHTQNSHSRIDQLLHTTNKRTREENEKYDDATTTTTDDETGSLAMVVCCVRRSRFLAHLLHLFSLHFKTSVWLTLAHGLYRTDTRSLPLSWLSRSFAFYLVPFNAWP
uniref:Putative secreted peptide n=1 Tax=Anopheles braziliensis TaxID=58242 RepID=A0A2M3ZP26_9DIPT